MIVDHQVSTVYKDSHDDKHEKWHHYLEVFVQSDIIGFEETCGIKEIPLFSNFNHIVWVRHVECIL